MSEPEIKEGQTWVASHSLVLRINSVSADGMVDYGHTDPRPISHIQAWITRVGAKLKDAA